MHYKVYINEIGKVVMIKSNLDDQQKLCMLAFLFDSGKIESSTYGEKVFE